MIAGLEPEAIRRIWLVNDDVVIAVSSMCTNSETDESKYPLVVIPLDAFPNWRTFMRLADDRKKIDGD